MVTMGEIGLAPLSYLLLAPAIETVGLQPTLAVCAALIALGSAAPVPHPAVRAIRLEPPTMPEQ